MLPTNSIETEHKNLVKTLTDDSISPKCYEKYKNGGSKDTSQVGF